MTYADTWIVVVQAQEAPHGHGVERQAVLIFLAFGQGGTFQIKKLRPLLDS